MADNCLFCKMVSGEMTPDIVYQNEEVLAFRDINPQAPVHVLIIPKRHVTTLNDMNDDDADLAGALLVAAARVAKQLGVAEAGYRTVVNTNREGGQVVFHVHMHLLAGRRMKWPPG